MTANRLLRSNKESTERIENIGPGFTSPAIIKNLKKGFRLASVQVVVDEEFDDPSAVLSVGTQTNNEQFMAEAENDITKIGEFITRPNFIDEVNSTTIRLYLDPGPSTQGKLTVYIKYL